MYLCINIHVCITRMYLLIYYVLSCRQRRIEIKTTVVFLHELKIEVLVFGDDTVTEMQNLQIFKSVQLYIKRTKRFTHLCLPFLFFFFHFSKNLSIMLYIVFHYCWRMYYCNYLLCGEDPCKLLYFVSNPVVIIFSNKICLI